MLRSGTLFKFKTIPALRFICCLPASPEATEKYETTTNAGGVIPPPAAASLHTFSVAAPEG